MMQLDITNAECIREIHSIGVTHVQNICSGKMVDVPWGSMDWLLAAGVGLLVAFAVILVVAVIVSIVTDL